MGPHSLHPESQPKITNVLVTMADVSSASIMRQTLKLHYNNGAHLLYMAHLDLHPLSFSNYSVGPIINYTEAWVTNKVLRSYSGL